MVSQELNELSRCISYFYGAPFDEVSDAESYCRGTGTINGTTLQQFWDNFSQNEEFMEQAGNIFVNNNIMILENGVYVVNPIMVSQEIVDNELNRCVNYFIGNRINNALDEGSTIETFCKGTGTAWDGLTIQEYLDDSQEAAKNDGYDFLEYAGQELLDAGVILQQIENLSYFEFTIDGKNTYTKEDIWYEIVLNHGNEHATRTTRIRDRLLKFTLVEIIDGTEKVLFNNRLVAKLD